MNGRMGLSSSERQAQCQAAMGSVTGVNQRPVRPAFRGTCFWDKNIWHIYKSGNIRWPGDIRELTGKGSGGVGMPKIREGDYEFYDQKATRHPSMTLPLNAVPSQLVWFNPIAFNQGIMGRKDNKDAPLSKVAALSTAAHQSVLCSIDVRRGSGCAEVLCFLLWDWNDWLQESCPSCLDCQEAQSSVPTPVNYP